MTMPLLGVFCSLHKLDIDIVCLCAKFDDSGFIRSRDIIGTPKVKMGHVTPTTPILKVICHPYAGT